MPEMKVSQFVLLHNEEIILKSAAYQSLYKLSDAALIRSVLRPKNRDYIVVNSKTGKVMQGNTRIYELKRRNIDIQVPYEDYVVDNTDYFPDVD